MVTATVRDSFYFRKVVPTCFPSECGESRLSELFFGKGSAHKKLKGFLVSVHFFAGNLLDHGDSAGRPAVSSMTEKIHNMHKYLLNTMVSNQFWEVRFGKLGGFPKTTQMPRLYVFCGMFTTIWGFDAVGRRPCPC